MVWNLAADALSWLRVIPPRCEKHVTVRERDSGLGPEDGNSRFIRVRFHLNFVTAPLAADLLLLALGAIGRREVHDGTIGADNISPIDVMGFFITLAYIAISIDASGLIRYLSYRILQWSRQNVRWGGGRWLFLYLYTFFFVLGTLVGNDPIVLSGTAFLAYMTRAARNIEHPRAWIFSQFAIANVASAILVSSNPTNLVLAGAFEIRFIDYTANMVVPVVITALLLFPFLLFVVFNDRRLVPREIEIHEAPTNANRDTTSSRSSGAQHGLDAASNLNSALDVRRRSTAGTLRPPPVNPNIPYARQAAALDEDPDASDPESSAALPLDEVLNPWVDRTGAIVGSVVMLVTLATVLALNATLADKTHLAVSWVTAPAAVIMLCWDLASGWRHRKETRAIARASKERIERFRARTASGTRQIRQPIELDSGRQATDLHVKGEKQRGELAKDSKSQEPSPVHFTLMDEKARESNYDTEAEAGRSTLASSSFPSSRTSGTKTYSLTPDISRMAATPAVAGEFCPPTSAYTAATHQLRRKPATLLFLAEDLAAWARETFPTATTVLSELPYALVPFAFSMFVLVQALVTNGWVPVFAYGWDRWVDRTGTIGAIGGMGFISVMLCNVGAHSSLPLLGHRCRHIMLTTNTVGSLLAPISAPPYF